MIQTLSQMKAHVLRRGLPFLVSTPSYLSSKASPVGPACEPPALPSSTNLLSTGAGPILSVYTKSLYNELAGRGVFYSNLFGITGCSWQDRACAETRLLFFLSFFFLSLR